jgi:hypothetical protein
MPGVKSLPQRCRRIWSGLANACAALSLLGCATMPSTAPQFMPAPPPAAGSGIVYFYRMRGPPKYRTPDVLVDGQLIFAPPAGAYTWSDFSEGVHRLDIKWGWGGAYPDIAIMITVTGHQAQFIKISSNAGGAGFIPTRTSVGAAEVRENDALRELAACCRFIQPH